MFWFVNAFVHQNVKDSVIKIQKYTFTDSIGNHLPSHTALASWQVGKLANVILKQLD